MESDIHSAAGTRSPLECFRATVCELLCLPAHAGEYQLRTALKSQGDDSLRWYESRRKAIEAYFRGREAVAGIAPAAVAQ